MLEGRQRMLGATALKTDTPRQGKAPAGGGEDEDERRLTVTTGWGKKKRTKPLRLRDRLNAAMEDPRGLQADAMRQTVGMVTEGEEEQAPLSPRPVHDGAGGGVALSPRNGKRRRGTPRAAEADPRDRPVSQRLHDNTGAGRAHARADMPLVPPLARTGHRPMMGRTSGRAAGA